MFSRSSSKRTSTATCARPTSSTASSTRSSTRSRSASRLSSRRPQAQPPRLADHMVLGVRRPGRVHQGRHPLLQQLRAAVRATPDAARQRHPREWPLPARVGLEPGQTGAGRRRRTGSHAEVGGHALHQVAPSCRRSTPCSSSTTPPSRCRPPRSPPSRASRSRATPANCTSSLPTLIRSRVTTCQAFSDREQHVLASVENVLKSSATIWPGRGARAASPHRPGPLLRRRHPRAARPQEEGGLALIQQLDAALDLLSTPELVSRPGPSRPVFDRMNLSLAVMEAAKTVPRALARLARPGCNPDAPKEHWTRVKALSRRLAGGGATSTTTSSRSPTSANTFRCRSS